ncbi:hypothetical protein KC331_g79 [Hortaea werneckii]|nr:hypothetical protein KC331_g79 [Hortaea werneckii]
MTTWGWAGVPTVTSTLPFVPVHRPHVCTTGTPRRNIKHIRLHRPIPIGSLHHPMSPFRRFQLAIPLRDGNLR